MVNSDLQIEGLCVNFPQFSNFWGHILQNRAPNFAIFPKKLPSRDRKMHAKNLPIFTKNTGENSAEIQKKNEEI
jgi:hypothetical protein